MPDLSRVAAANFKSNEGCRPENKNGPVPGHHGVHHEAIFVHEVQAPKRGRNFGATHRGPRGVFFINAFAARVRSP
jgi:hypothetical protein